MARKQVDEQGEPWPPEEAVAGLVYNEWDESRFVALDGLSPGGGYYHAHDIVSGITLYPSDVIPANEFTRQVMAAWATDWAFRAQFTAYLGKLSSDLRNFGVGVSVESLRKMTSAERERLIAIVADGRLEDKDLLVAIQKAIKSKLKKETT